MDDIWEADDVLRYNDIPSLEKMTIYKISQVLWSNEFVPFINDNSVKWTCYHFEHKKRDCNCQAFCKLRERNLRMKPGKLNLKRLLVEKIKKMIKVTEKLAKNWAADHMTSVFYEHKDARFAYQHINEIIWSYNGSVDLIRTAESMLSSARLSDVEKFRIISMFCMEHKLCNVPQSVFDEKNVDSISFYDQPLEYYWFCRMTGDMSKINCQPEDVNNFILSQERVDNLPAIVYFWEKVDEEEQYCAAMVKIRCLGHADIQIQCGMISRLHSGQQDVVFTRNATDILINLCNSYLRDDYYLKTVNYVGRYVKTDGCVTLLHNFGKWISKDKRRKEYDILTLFFKETWKTLRDYVKEFLFTEHMENGECIFEFMEHLDLVRSRDVVQELLKDVNAADRQKLMNSFQCELFCSRLADDGKFDYLGVLCEEMLFVEMNEAMKTKFLQLAEKNSLFNKFIRPRRF